jgi:ELWxxDGT repeat protein
MKTYLYFLHLISNKLLHQIKSLLFGIWLLLNVTSVKAQVELIKSDFNPTGEFEQVTIDLTTNVNGTLFFRVSKHDIDNFNNNFSLWKSNGTAAGTVMVKDFGSIYFQTVTSTYSTAQSFTSLDGNIFFQAYDPAHGTELWKSNGTAAGTIMVKDINPGMGDSNPVEFTKVGNRIFFQAYDPANGTELWKSDGTATGTIMVKDIYPGYEGSGANFLTAVGNTLYFIARDQFHGFELWQSDGNESGTVLVKDINPGTAGNLGQHDWLTASNNTLYLSANNSANSNELWKSDGSAAGTVMVKDIFIGEEGSYPYWLTSVGSLLYFTAYDENYSNGLWKSDGNESGTLLLKDNIIIRESGYRPIGTMGNSFYFNAEYNQITGLWKSDGTVAGTIVLNNIASQWLTTNGNTLYFSTPSENALWKTDGTVAGTVKVHSFSSPPECLVPLNNNLIFSTNSDLRSANLWKYIPSGTNAAPVMAAISNKTAVVGANLSFTVSASDPDIPAQILTYSATNLPSRATFDAETRTFSWTPKNNQPGEYSVRFHVSDGSLSDNKDVKITVVKAAAIIPSISSFTPSSGSFGTQVTITGSNLGEATLVTFSGVSAFIHSKSSTTIVASVPSGATSGKIAVTTPGGTATSKQNFRVTNPSAVSAMKASTMSDALFETYPNPFSGVTTIFFSLENEEDYALEVFDMRGILVKRIASGVAEANKLYEFVLKSDGLAEGVYVTRLITTSKVQTLKSVLKR